MTLGSSVFSLGRSVGVRGLCSVDGCAVSDASASVGSFEVSPFSLLVEAVVSLGGDCR
jgi:hypothetical protein